MRKYLILLAFFIMPFFTRAQINTDSLLIDLEIQNRETFNSRIYTFTSKKKDDVLSDSKTYESLGTFHSSYIILNSDLTYVYYSVFEVCFELTFGKWSQLNNDTLLLNWDKQKTLANFKDEKQYKRYFEYSVPTALPMTNWLVRRTKEKLEPIK